jgi:P-type Cu+ transporter
MNHGQTRDVSDQASKTERDPVCSMMVDPARTPHKCTHQGKTIYFCAAKCREKFEADPLKYLEPRKPDAPAAPVPSSTYYTCPMDPEVRQLGPGHCPKCGMALEPEEALAEDASADVEIRSMALRFIVATLLTVPVLFLAMGGREMGWVALHDIDMRTSQWLQLLLCAPVVFWCGYPFLERGWQSLISRHLNMFTLIATGTLVAFAYSAVATFFPDLFPHGLHGAHGAADVYFESAAVIVTLVLLGQVLELKARQRTAGAIRALLKLVPETVQRLRADGSQETVSLAQLHPGDRLRIRPGDRVPVDGPVVDGEGVVDEAMLTGEPMPVEKRPGSTVVAGTINLEGSFVLEARQLGKETVLSKIVSMVAMAQRSRPPVQQLADRVSAWFVPAVVLVAVAAFASWLVFGPEPQLAYAIVAAVSVLVIACPCALGLATPMSVMVGVGRGAQSGVLVRSAEAMQRLEEVTTIVFDKTGTLTEGKPTISAIELQGSVSAEDVLALTASIERASAHPLASAFVLAAEQRGLKVSTATSFNSIAGQGVKGEVGGRQVAVGNAKLMQSLGVLTDGAAHAADQLRAQGQAAVFVAVDGQMAAVIGVVDPVKPAAAAAISWLKAQGLHVVMLTGDNSVTAHALAKLTGVDEVMAEAMPADKLRVIQEMKARGAIVAMAGDGINDAPALAAADVGIAMGTGTDIAIESAGITLVKGDIRGIVRAITLSKAMMGNIRQNLFFAFVYNAVGVLAAAGLAYPLFGILLNPGIAAGAMSLSSVSVIANALRLRALRLT